MRINIIDYLVIIGTIIRMILIKIEIITVLSSLKSHLFARRIIVLNIINLIIKL